MTECELRNAHDDLMACHDEIREEFSNLDHQTLALFLSEYDSPELRQQVRKHGDGHTLFSVPKTVDELKTINVAVLFAVTSPKLGWSSDFDPMTPLHSIPYWRDNKRIRPRLSVGTRRYSLLFMAWQQNFAIHGIDDAHARKNRRLLLNRRPQLDRLFRQEEEAAIEFVYQLCEWLISEGNPFLVVTQVGKTNFRRPIANLRANPAVTRMEAQLRGKNYRIMERIGEELLDLHGY